MSNFQKVLIIVFLCVAVIFISGILLPRYLSSQILELRNELKSQDGNSKYSLQANLVPVAEKYTQDESKGSKSSRNVEATEVLPSVLSNNSIQSLVKVKRSKRQIMRKDEHYTWNFHFNMTRQQNTLQEMPENASDTSRKDKLGMSIHNEGEGNRRDASADIQLTLLLAEYYLRELFKHTENGTQENMKKELAHSEKIQFDFSTLDAAGSGDEQFVKKREGKFFNLGSLNIFGFGQSPEKNVLPSTVSKMPETESVSMKDELVTTTQSPQTDFFTENSQETNFQAQSLVSEVLNLANNTSGSSLPGKTEDGECVDCDAVGLELPITSNIENLTKNYVPETVISSVKFTDEFLEMFCTRLANNVGVSQHLSDTEDINFETKQNSLNDIPKSPENPVFDSLSSSVSEKKLNLDFVTENFLLSSNASVNELRQKKFLSFGSLFAGFGSGRSADGQDESDDLSSEGFADVDLEKLPTLLDCENYFRKKIRMLAKPNLMDMLNDPNIQLADFGNTTISSELIERLQSLTDLLKTNFGNNNVETSGKNSEGAMTKSVYEETTFESFGSAVKEVQKEILVHTEPNDLDWNTNILLTSTNISKVESTTELRSDGRLFSMFGFGSGNGESRSLGTEVFDTDGNEILGSGDMRSLSVVDIDRNKLINEDSRSLRTAVSVTDENEFGSGESRSLLTSLFGTDGHEFGSGDSRSFKDAAFGSGDSRLLEAGRNGIGDSRSLKASSFGIEEKEVGSGDSFKETFPDLYEDLKSISSNKERIWGVFGLTGSGDGRDLSESIEVSHIKKCENNCSFETTTEEPYDCNDYGCGFNDSDNLLEDHDLKNEKGCHEGCLDDVSNTSNDHGKTEANFNILEQIPIDKNLTAESFQRSFSSNASLEIVSFSSKILKNESGTLDESEQDCDDCNFEDIREMNKSTEGDYASFSDCDKCNECNSSEDCSFEDIREMNKSTEGDYVFSDCDKCNECNSSEECNSSISHVFDQSEQILPTEELVVIGKNRGRADENLETSNNTTGANVANDLTDEESIGSSKAPNVIESPHVQFTESTQRFFGPIFLTGSGDGGLFEDSGGPINLLEEEENTSADTKDNRTDEKKIDSSEGNIIETPEDEQTTERNAQRFLGTIFLTGSGDGGLFEDSGGLINLVEEEESKSLNVSLRQSRLDDISLNFSEVLHESSMKESKQEHHVDGKTPKERFTSPVAPLRRRGRVDDTDHEFMKKDDSDFSKRVKTEFGEMPQTNENKIAVTVSSEVIKSNNSILGDLTKPQFQPRPCTAARECNVTLNERCIMTSTRVCGCSRGYIRNKETRKCIVKKVVETSIKLPAENFEEDLKNPFSPSFQQRRKSSIEMIRLLLQNDPELLRALSEIEMVKFSAGSLVITLNLVFAVENKSEAQLVKHVEDNIQISLRDERLMNAVSLDIKEASLLSVNGEIDYCKSSELNYCSEHAYCVSNTAIPGSYACHCKEHYRDVSFDPRHIGETCLAKCPQEYCGLYGHCELLANDEKLCLCSGLYFGRRCEVPGLYVLIVLGFVGFVSITMLVLVVFKRRCSRFTYVQAHGSEENEMQSHMNGRVSDAIAMEQNIGATKFVTISTPKPHPAIKVTRPTTTESGSSYDFDSTFDSTPSVRKTEENSTV